MFLSVTNIFTIPLIRSDIILISFYKGNILMKKTLLQAMLLGSIFFTACDHADIFVDNRSSVIPIDTNIDFGIEKNILYFADPRPEENGENRALRIDYNLMQYEEIDVLGTNPHSIDRAGKSDKFYLRTQNSYSFDIANFKEGTVKTVDLADSSRDVIQHKPRAIGAYNDKYKIQLLSAKDMPTVDVIDTETDTVLATVGDQNNNYTVGTNAGEDGTGHALWFDEDHFGLIDRVSKLIRVYKAEIDANNIKTFTHIQDLDSGYPIHAIERINDATTKADSLTFYAMVDGDVNNQVAPSVLELTFNQRNNQLYKGKEIILTSSVDAVESIKPTTHHMGLTLDHENLIVPVLDGKVYIIKRSDMSLVKIINAKLGAAHVNVSNEENVIVITNHFSDELTFIDATTFEVIKNLKISTTVYDEADKHLLQPHFSYIGEDGRYYYTFATQDGDFLKVDLRTLEIVDTLHTGGAPEQSHS